MTKKELRKAQKARLASLAPDVFHDEGEKAAMQLIASPLWQQFDRVLAYLSMPDEIDTQPVMYAALASGKTVFAPKVESDTGMRFYRVTRDANSWTTGPFGIREPAGNEADALTIKCDKRCEQGDHCDQRALVLSPGLAFDHKGRRCGRGRGFYDRFYQQLKIQCPYAFICAFSLSCGVIDEEVPTESFDQRVNAICTTNGLEVIEVL
jgi:5-formyltetrahydrofolate cyclo-ligase